MKTTRRASALTAILLGALALPGCRYQAGFLIPAGVESIHVEVAANETFWREAAKTDNLDTAVPLAEPRPAFTMEAELTERIKNEIVRRTPLRLAHKANADSVLRTTIVSVTPETRFRDSEDELLAQRVSILVDFVWIDRRSGRALAEGKGLTRATDFVVDRGENFTTAARKNFDYIAKMIVERMQEGF